MRSANLHALNVGGAEGVGAGCPSAQTLNCALPGHLAPRPETGTQRTVAGHSAIVPSYLQVLVGLFIPRHQQKLGPDAAQVHVPEQSGSLDRGFIDGLWSTRATTGKAAAPAQEPCPYPPRSHTTNSDPIKATAQPKQPSLENKGRNGKEDL